MPFPRVTVAVPTLAAGGALADCLRSLESQTFQDFETVVVDNSGTGLAGAAAGRTKVIANTHNVGFGAAVNQAFRASSSPLLAILNDDAVAHSGWLASMVAASDRHARAGMFASQVRLAGSEVLDSTGMLIAADGSSKQRDHGAPSASPGSPEALCASGAAALFRREMLDQIGMFDENYFLYCEDTDLGLRARWAGWECVYVAGAIVDHRYSHSAGRASPLKAYYVERNRIFTIVKNFPPGRLLAAPFASLARYFWHAWSLFEGQGKASEFRLQGHAAILLPFLVLRAHAAVLFRLPYLLSERRRIRKTRRLSVSQFEELLARHSISLRRVAAL